MVSTKYVLGLVRNQAQSDAIVTVLLNSGFVRRDISTHGDLVHGLPMPLHVSTSSGIGTGIGAVVGLLVGLGLHTIPGVGPLIGAGLMMAMLGSTGAALGWVSGSFIGIGLVESEARHYEKKIREGAILLSIRVDDRSQRSHARTVLAGYGATHIATVGEGYTPHRLVPTF